MIRTAFTLIELLVVMVIIGILATLILPFVGMGQDGNAKNVTRVLQTQLAVAINQFVAETGSVPLPTGSASDPLSGSWYPTTNDGAWDKQQLAWRLTHKMSMAEKIKMNDEAWAAELAVDPFQNEQHVLDTYDMSTTAGVEAVDAMMKTAIGGLPGNAYFDTYYFRLSTYWNVLSGETNVDYEVGRNSKNPLGYVKLSGRGFYKVHYMAMKGDIAGDLERRRYLTHPCLDLADLNDEFVNDQTIIDAWDNPLIYVAHSTPAYGERRYYNRNGGNYERPISAPVGGRAEITDRNRDGSINKDDWKIEPPYEDLIDNNRDQKFDAQDHIDQDGNGSIDRNDWGSILWNAIPGRGSSFFLASAGPDGLFNCLPPESVNDDNILLIEDYND